MVEPDYSGSALINRRTDLLEVVEGLGTSLEEGKNTTYIYTREQTRSAQVFLQNTSKPNET